MCCMYLRHSTRRKDGKAHIYWQLVRSIRCGHKVKQQTVAHLGELDAEGRASAARLAQQITDRDNSGLQDLCQSNAPVEAVKVRLDAGRLEHARSFGVAGLDGMASPETEGTARRPATLRARSRGLGRRHRVAGHRTIVRAVQRTARGRH